MAAAASLLMALATIASPPSTASPQEALAAPAPPTYHIWPSARSSQDISGPIGIKMANGSLVWHVFVDCAGAGAGGRDLDWCHFSSFDLVSPLAFRPGSLGKSGLPKFFAKWVWTRRHRFVGSCRMPVILTFA